MEDTQQCTPVWRATASVAAQPGLAPLVGQAGMELNLPVVSYCRVIYTDNNFLGVGVGWGWGGSCKGLEAGVG